MRLADEPSITVDNCIFNSTSYENATVTTYCFFDTSLNANITLNNSSFTAIGKGSGEVRTIVLGGGGTTTTRTSTTTINNCDIKSINDSTGNSYGVILFSESSATINNTSIDVSSDNADSKGIDISPDSVITITNTNIFADASDWAASEGRHCSVGISNYGTLNFYSGSVTGTHSGLNTGTGSKTYIYGGSFASCSHGGIYFAHGSTGEAYVENATIACKNYNGKYDKTNFTDSILAAFYVGSGSNMSVYMDSCTINSMESTALVLRGTEGEQNNSVYISNTSMKCNRIRIDNETLKLYIGTGVDDLTENNVEDIVDNPGCVTFTNETYKR